MRFPDRFYETPRRVLLPGKSTLEKEVTPIQEKWLYPIWSHQRLKAPLWSVDGAALKILHPGFCNVESGPDFKNAFISIGENPPQQCDIEIDIDPCGWKAHSHEGNPAYEKVALHVVWNVPKGFVEDPARPVLDLQKYLDAPLEELLEWENTEAGQNLPDNVLGKCAPSFRQLAEADVNNLFEQAVLVRMKSKSFSIAATARNYGWERTLYIHLLRGLGYKQNPWPMQRLGEMIPASTVSLVEMQAHLLGISGMIPEKLSEKDSAKDDYIINLWNVWWRKQSALKESIFPGSVWKLSGTRPINHPQRRIALASHWLTNPRLIEQLERWVELDLPTTKAAEMLLKILSPSESDEFWEHHYTLRSKRIEEKIPLLGMERVSDLYINVIAPWLWARTRGESSTHTEEQILKHYLCWPASGNNARIGLALKRFYGNEVPVRLKYAFQQQAVLQITDDFCSKTNPCCHDCPLADSLKQE